MLRKRRMPPKCCVEQKTNNLEDSILSPNCKNSDESFDPDNLILKDLDIDTIMKCEASFFCEVLCRLSKEIKHACDLNDLDKIICLASKFLLASAAKEKAIANQIAASKGLCCQEKFDPDCQCSLEDPMENNCRSEPCDENEQNLVDNFIKED